MVQNSKLPKGKEVLGCVKVVRFQSCQMGHEPEGSDRTSWNHARTLGGVAHEAFGRLGQDDPALVQSSGAEQWL